MKRNGFKRALPLLLMLLAVTAMGVSIYIVNTNKEALVISHESGMYSDSFDLKIHSMRRGTILYTTDGHTPDKEYENVKEYDGPIELICGEDTSTYSFQVCCYYPDGSSSEVYRRDYILDPEGVLRFTTNYVVSITGNEEALFGDEAGIFVRGSQYYEYLEEYPDHNVLGTAIPANYLADIEVPVHAAIFKKGGEQIIDQNCGIKIYGNMTRQHNQKSFRLYARYDYDSVNEFSYPFFPDLYSDVDGTVIDEYQRLSFHNSGNDNDYGYIRTELTGKLARNVGFPDTLTAESVTVYINGKYQGVYWLQNTFDDRYFKEKYGDYEGEMVTAYGGVCDVYVGEVDSPPHVVADEYNAFCDWVATADMSNDENWKRVCDTIDINNFAQYFAIQYYTGNFDWPHCNVKVFRYMAADGETYTEDGVFDGRYRYLLFDTDYSFGLLFLDIHGPTVRMERLHNYINNTEVTGLFGACVQREEFRNLFVGYVLAMMNETFTQDNVSQVMYEYNLTRYDELRYMIEETDLLKESIWKAWGVGEGGMEDTEVEWGEVVTYAAERPAVVINELQRELDCGPALALNVSLQEEGSIYLGNINVGKVFSGTWMENVLVNIYCELPAGMKVEGYYVNGTYIEGEELNIYPTEIAGALQGLKIEPVISYEEVGDLVIDSYHTDDSMDYIILRNNGTASVLLSEYSITDDSSDYSKGHLSTFELEPGETFTVYGEKYTDAMDENSVQVPFSWNDEEKIYLYHQTMGVVDSR